MDEHVCLTVVSRSNESVENFNRRLIAFWSHVLRTRPIEYQGVYAESARSEVIGVCWRREYLARADVVETLETELVNAGLDHNPIDRNELYSKYEATPPNWFLIPH